MGQWPTENLLWANGPQNDDADDDPVAALEQNPSLAGQKAALWRVTGAATASPADAVTAIAAWQLLVALSEELNLTVAAMGVHVSAICPGFTHTDFHETAGLMEMKNNMAKWLWCDADVVVRDALRGVEAAKPVVVSGRLYRWLDPIFQSVWTRRLLRIKARPE